ncbi:hypothetical protein BXT84_13130 [Sulfobacillus thermotolerans]|uniref:Nudix hydrolase domain-containing protein n=1 Tax=Sulfobacillus thermotolerans TaxID=338644 RepID=A0ABM6RTI0_9FIRM|nr:hypothetical protein BXT84_13130 [Sulfobacillus thermotolerans]
MTPKYCANCQGRLRKMSLAGHVRFGCPQCGLVAYGMVRLGVAALLCTRSGDIVLVKRALQPGFGHWTMPGGYIEEDETPRQAVRREIHEELGIAAPQELSLTGVYREASPGAVTIVYQGVITDERPHVLVESLNVRPFAISQIPWSELYFLSTRDALHDWICRHASY